MALGALMRAERDGLSFRTLSATLTGLILVGALASVIGAERTAALARDGRSRELSLLALATTARMRPLGPFERARLARALGAQTGLRVLLVSRGDPLARDAPYRRSRADEGTAFAVVAERVDAEQTLVVSAPTDRPRALLVGVLARVLAVLLATGALGVAVSLAVARDIASELRAIAAQARAMLLATEVSPRPLPVHGGDEVGALVLSFNRLQRVYGAELSRHREALTALEESERRREAWVSTLRHELRTPLNAIKGFADVLLAEIDGELTAAQHEDVEAIASAGTHLLRLVDDVLDLSAMATGRYAVTRGPCDLGAITRDVVSEAQGIARGRGVELRLDGEGSLTLVGDPVALRRAVTNLVLNAVEHAGGQVRVRVERRPREATVAVEDNGPGIASSELRRLFRPFERGGSAEARGAGLGLAITVALVDLHGGNLSAQSEVGRGSTFTIHLPREAG